VFSIAIKSLQGVAMYSDAAPAYRQKWRTHKEVGAAIDLVKKGDPKARAFYIAALEKFAERMEGNVHPLRRVADQLEIPLS